ncbi:hypothetical protein P152DRAFT_268255 [Eremomyces bilateralis CBS 781.70]|uniref:Vacuolar import and degradation protein n=1 Tax=Eremomyces bilateralis CBS 781.70 TaxID=1392243 RepID=A0A6G1G8U1_9PEZI|nr:uncharacterized protein P152DRAFT_268255 [Eremomyces bilateralis CBS 781.70]KAF1814341.1 hypothetical protein P152DRAFT_268255 [Eremomyces bilateralis CBS 781.70]
MSPIANAAMPTPSDVPLSPPLEPIVVGTVRPSCPPDDTRDANVRGIALDEVSSPSTPNIDRNEEYTRPIQEPTPPIDSPCTHDELVALLQSPRNVELKGEEMRLQEAYRLMHELEQKRQSEAKEKSDSSFDIKEPIPSIRSPPSPKTKFVPNTTSSYLRPGAKFHGAQQSDRQQYDVQVEIIHVDIADSFLCGYLRIQGLTDDHPMLTTYFDAEIIGTKHTFLTKNETWGSSEKTDMQHWGRFPAWKPLAKAAKRADFSYKNFAQREHLFMRWKEHFLVPDHRIQTLTGASFEGFYYICFNQVTGTISGIYFHSKSEKYQQLELKPVEEHGWFQPAYEFR